MTVGGAPLAMKQILPEESPQKERSPVSPGFTGAVVKAKYL